MKIAVVGSGISGLVCAHVLSSRHEITMFEARDRLGGHTHTVDVEAADGTHAVDTGFIVHNDWTYPNFIALMNQLGVRRQKSSMSFSVHDEQSGLEYNPSDLNGVYAQRRNLVNPGFQRMLLEILRFNRQAPELLEQQDPGPTLGQYLQDRGYSQRFIHHYILPMGCAIWSAGTDRMRKFPAKYFVRFFHNHGMLSVNERPQWWVLQGGSRAYLDPITARYRERIRLSEPVLSVTRDEEGVSLRTTQGVHRFDEVVIAAHSDQALRMLQDPTDEELRVLSAIPYQRNDVILHTDTRVMPRHERAWAAWNYRLPKHEREVATLTYNMNILQSLNAEETYLVSVNPDEDSLDPSRVVKRLTYHHPVFLPEGVQAQARHEAINGKRRTYFAGAYWGFGFHEDGVKSALTVCEQFGLSL